MFLVNPIVDKSRRPSTRVGTEQTRFHFPAAQFRPSTIVKVFRLWCGEGEEGNT